MDINHLYESLAVFMTIANSSLAEAPGCVLFTDGQMKQLDQSCSTLSAPKAIFMIMSENIGSTQSFLLLSQLILLANDSWLPSCCDF